MLELKNGHHELNMHNVEFGMVFLRKFLGWYLRALTPPLRLDSWWIGLMRYQTRWVQCLCFRLLRARQRRLLARSCWSQVCSAFSREDYPVPVATSAIDLRFSLGIEEPRTWFPRCLTTVLCWKFSLRTGSEYVDVCFRGMEQPFDLWLVSLVKQIMLSLLWFRHSEASWGTLTSIQRLNIRSKCTDFPSQVHVV